MQMQYFKKTKKDIIDSLRFYQRVNNDLIINKKKDSKNEKGNLIENMKETKSIENIIQSEQNNKNIIEYSPKDTTLMEETKLNEKSNKDTNFIDFYDVIVNINSIKDICKGWNVEINENTKPNYENLKKQKVVKIGLIGNSNKGKSFLLSKISKISIPSGKSIRTEGLSIKYPEMTQSKDKNIVLLNSDGLETPVLKDEEKEAKNDNKEQLKKKIYDNKEMEKIFREKLREKLAIESFLQNYIIINSDIIIFVTWILSYSEQKLLSKIKKLIFNLKNRSNINNPISLFIIPNLIIYKTRAQVEDYINNILMKSATFSLEKCHIISTEKEEKVQAIIFMKNQMAKKSFI